MLKGGCFCGKVRYEASGVPFNSTICHCIDCRRASAAPLVAWFSIDPAQLLFVQGEPKFFTSSGKAVRSFCPDCGTPLTFRHVDFPDEIDITTCSLDMPELIPPQDHTRTERKLPWVHMTDGLPYFQKTRSDS
jgi:hypothetical protein